MPGAGGTALLKNGTYYVTHVLPDSYGAIIGQGAATVLQAVPGTSGYMIALKTPATTQQVTIRDLALIPNVGSAGNLGGILLDNTGFSAHANPQHVLTNVNVIDATGDAYHFDNNARAMTITGCYQTNALGNGFYLGNGPASGGKGCTDSSFVGCQSGPSLGHGFYLVGGWNNYFSSCKGYFSGFNGNTGLWNTTSCNFEITSGCQNTVFTGCSAQSAALHNWDLEGCSYISVVGCEADDASDGGVGLQGCAINLNACTNCSIIGNTGNGSGDLTHAGIQVTGELTGTMMFGNSVTGNASGPFSYVSGGGYFLIGPFNADFSGIPGGVKFGNIDVEVAGAGLRVKEGTNCKQGTAVLVAGTVTVADTAVTASSRIFLTSQADGGTPGFLRVSARTAGTSFTITSSSGTDTSTVAYEIFEPG